jgi:hypothetical protein
MYRANALVALLNVIVKVLMFQNLARVTCAPIEDGGIHWVVVRPGVGNRLGCSAARMREHIGLQCSIVWPGWHRTL